VLQVEALIFLDNSGARFLFVSTWGHLGTQIPIFSFYLNDNPVFGHLLLDQDNFLNTLDDEVSTRVIGAFFSSGQLLMVHVT